MPATPLMPTLSAYIGRRFLVWVLGMFCALTALVFLFDAIELLRRGANRENASLALLVQMAAIKLPHMAQSILPFALLFGGMLAFNRMSRSRELVVVRAAGVSIWRILLPAVAIALLLGLVKIMVLNPVASVMTARYELLETRVLRERASTLALSSGDLWLRQRTPSGHWILRAGGANGDISELSAVSVLMFDDNDRFHRRLDADSAVLHSGYWRLRGVVSTTDDGASARWERHDLPTDLTADSIQDSFASPETLSFWNLPGFIRVLEETGFSAVRHRLYWHSLLASPLLLCAMVLIAAIFALHQGLRGTLPRATAGLFVGFFVYFMSDLLHALGLSSRVPAVLGAWTPAIVASLLGVTGLLHLEDG